MSCTPWLDRRSSYAFIKLVLHRGIDLDHTQLFVSERRRRCAAVEICPLCLTCPRHRRGDEFRLKRLDIEQRLAAAQISGVDVEPIVTARAALQANKVAEAQLRDPQAAELS